MKNLAILFAIIFVLAGAVFSLIPASRFGSFIDGSNRISNCQTGLAKQNAPVKRSATLLNYYVTSRPIKESTQNWGTCPYSHYKAKTFAAELWVIGVALGLAALWFSSKASASPKSAA